MVRNPPGPPPMLTVHAAERIRAAALSGLFGTARQFAPSSSYLRRFSGSAEHFVGFVDLLEACSAALSPDSRRVILPRELPKRLLDLLVRGRLGHAKRGVVILEFHATAPESVQ